MAGVAIVVACVLAVTAVRTASLPSIRFRTEGLLFTLAGIVRRVLRLFFAMGKIRGTPCMGSHISVHRATIKYFSNSFVFKTEIEKEGLPGDITPDLGAGGPRFKSGRPDH
jgi:hypothetical protein